MGMFKINNAFPVTNLIVIPTKKDKYLLVLHDSYFFFLSVLFKPCLIT